MLVTSLDLRISPQQHNYWRAYHPVDVLERFEAIHRVYTVASTGVLLHVDAYEQPVADAPVIVFNHGAGGYSRLFIPLALALYDAGYTVLCPDQRGQGLSEGERGDFTIPQLVRNVLDVVQWARDHYTGQLFLAGGSVGGALTYYAAAAGAPVRAMVCHNLYDFGWPRNTLALSRFHWLRRVPGVPTLFAGVIQGGAALLPHGRLPGWLLSRFDKMVDARVEQFYDLWQQDPYPIRSFSLRYLASTFTTSPAVPLEENSIPVLVINQRRDQMVPPEATQENYARLGGEKHYVEIDYGHWAIGHGFEQAWVSLVDAFLQPR